VKIYMEDLKKLKDQSIVAVYDGIIDKVQRVIVPYCDKFYVVFWYKFSSDGSFYCGIRDKDATQMTGGVTSVENGILSVVVDENNFENKPKKDRFSFHGSGEIHAPLLGENTYRLPITDIKHQDEIFKVLFKDISLFEEITVPKKLDLCTLMYVPEMSGLMLDVSISPLGQNDLKSFNDGKNHFTAVINYKATDKIPAFTIQFVFVAIPTENKPKYSILAWPARQELSTKQEN